jgi:hypothetical protein
LNAIAAMTEFRGPMQASEGVVATIIAPAARSQRTSVLGWAGLLLLVSPGRPGPLLERARFAEEMTNGVPFTRTTAS